MVDVKSYNGLSSELYISFEFEAKKLYLLYIHYTSYKLMADKQTYFENLHHQKNVYLENKLN